jgi:hypothetical protein
VVCAHPARGDGHGEMFVDPPEAVVRDHESALPRRPRASSPDAALPARLVPVRRAVSRFLALGVRNESVRSRRAVGVEGSKPVTLRYRIRIGAPLPEGVTAEIERRFGPVGALTNRNRRPVLRGLVTDQSALRGLLALRWDLNADVIGLHVRDAPPGRSRAPDDAHQP